MGFAPRLLAAVLAAVLVAAGSDCQQTAGAPAPHSPPTWGATAVLLDPSLPNFDNTLAAALTAALTAAPAFGGSVRNVSVAEAAAFLQQGASSASSAPQLFVVATAPALPPALFAPLVAFATKGKGSLVQLGGCPPRIPTSILPTAAFTLNMMSPHSSYALRGVVNATVAANQAVVSAAAWRSPSGRFSGVSAVSWHEMGAADFVPLLVARDAYGRDRGFASAVTFNNASAGPFGGSRWVLSGITQRAFYTDSFVSAVLLPALLAPPPAPPTMPATSRPLIPEPLQQSMERLRIVGSDFVFPNGSRFFMSGANLYRSSVLPDSSGNIDNNFAQAAAMGANALRLFAYEQSLLQGGSKGADFLTALRKAAHKYDIRVVLTLDYDPKSGLYALEDIRNQTLTLARLLADEDWILAFDLGNEPYFWELGELTFPNGTKLADVYNVSSHGNDSLSNFLAQLNPGFNSVFQNLVRGLGPIPPRFQPVVRDVEAIYTTWQDCKIGALRSVFPNASQTPFVTTGFNTIYGMLPAEASRLDFVNEHVYPNAPGSTFTFHNFTEALYVPTTGDRIHANWAALNVSKPITYGEFGVSDGDSYPAGRGGAGGVAFVTLQESCAYDAATWLTLLARGYAGGNRWRVFDKPYPLEVVEDVWLGNDSVPANHLKYEREAYFGLYCDDGTLAGRPKPVALWLRFFGFYIRTRGGPPPSSSCDLNLKPSPESATQLAHVLQTDDALFCGGWVAASCSPALAYSVAAFNDSGSADSGDIASLGMFWTADAIHLQATGDMGVWLQLSGQLPVKSVQHVQVRGSLRAWRAIATNNTLFLQLFEGEGVVLQ